MYSDKNIIKTIVVFVESCNGDVTNLSKELIEEANKLSKISNHKICALIIGNNLEKDIESLKKLPIDEIVVYDDEKLAIFTEDRYSEVLCNVVEEKNPDIVLIGATIIGKSISPVAATRFKTSLTADCVDLKFDNEMNLVQIRPAYSGNLMAEIISQNCRPQLVTMRERNLKFQYFNNLKFKNIKVNKMGLPICNIQSLVIDKIEKELDDENLNNFQTLIVAGNGFKTKDDLDKVFKLAEHLNAKVVSTRALVERGIFEYKNQIGFSGKSVSPKLLITLGVSGSIQFQAGIKNAEYIIAVNNDSEAPIFTVCNEGYVGDMYKIVEDLLTKFERGSEI
ncbi:electron transfer flavoprotein subunit alpha/FixB family protein [Cetobacterium sp.]|uniref:electron transfer flavoprotein subunit alpha/FixB family protein n=1 Tax=Cetobacterium sp. TaxID=2071632 RepID=UPI003F3B34FD